MSLTTDQRLLIEMQVTNNRKSTGVAYALWFFLGLLSVHRFYLERPISAIFQIILNCLLIGLIWTFIDVFLIPGMIRDLENKHRASLYGTAIPPSAMPAVDTSKWSAKDREAYQRQREQ